MMFAGVLEVTLRISLFLKAGEDDNFILLSFPSLIRMWSLHSKKWLLWDKMIDDTKLPAFLGALGTSRVLFGFHK